MTTPPVMYTKQSPVDNQPNSVIAQHPPLDWRSSRGRDRYTDRDQVAAADVSSNAEGSRWRAENTQRNFAGN